MNAQIQKAAVILRQGGIVIFPTDTAFGIGCRIDNPKSIERLFTLRKRPVTQATPVLASSIDMLQPFIKPISDEVRVKLIEPFWPGALTIVTPCYTEKISRLVRGGTDTLGVRIPNHPMTLEMIQNVGVPILGTSANFHGEKTPFRVEELDPGLVSLVDYVLPGECLMKEASTVIDITQKPWKILRQGAIRIPNIS